MPFDLKPMPPGTNPFRSYEEYAAMMNAPGPTIDQIAAAAIKVPAIAPIPAERSGSAWN